MKKFKIILSAFVLVIMLFSLSGCGASNVDFDLASSGNAFTYSTVEKMKNSPREYINKTFKIKGKLSANGGTYHYMSGYDSTNCCSWTLEVRTIDDLQYPNTSNNVTATGTYKSTKVNGKTSYFLEINEFN